MNDDTMMLDQAGEEILDNEVSDEALEAAAGTERGLVPLTWNLTSFVFCP